MSHLAAPYQRSDPRAFLNRSCGRKVVHPSEDVAEAARRLTEASTGDGPLHSYRCDFCAGWHVGHVARAAVGSWPDAERRQDERSRRGRTQRRGGRRRRRWELA